MAVNLNSGIQSNQNVTSIFNPQTRLKDVASDKRDLETLVSPVNKAEKSVPVKQDAEAIARLDAQRNKNAQTNLDNPDRRTRQALNAYRDVAQSDKREEIQSLVGVDFFV